jgi:hypothetical protein
MTDEQTSDAASRRARLATRRHRLRIVGATLAVVIIIASVTTAVALNDSDAGPLPSKTKTTTAKGNDSSTTLNLGAARELAPPRALSHADPLRLWVGGDSLAGSFGPALGKIASETGVVDANIDYKVSSGLADQGIRDWPEHAEETMASDDPDAVVFIIGTNDASIANTYDSDNDGHPDWEADYREKIDHMMEILVGGSRHRTVFWLGPPTLGDDALDRGAKLLGPVMQEEAAKYAPDVVYIDTYHLFEGPDGGYSRSLPDADGNDVDMRISDGIHFSADGAEYLSDAVWKLLNKRWHITEQADPSEPIDYSIAPGAESVPGLGHYRPTTGNSSSDGNSSSNGSSSTTTPSATTRPPKTGTTIKSTPTVVTGTTTVHSTAPQTTAPHSTTPVTPKPTTPVTPKPTPTTKPTP